MGTAFHLPIVHCTKLAQTLLDLHARFHTTVVAVHPHAGKTILQKSDYTKDLCLVFGSEGEGISKDILAVCNDAVAIPMQAGVDSLNVASASAVILYEVMRQRMV